MIWGGLINAGRIMIKGILIIDNCPATKRAYGTIFSKKYRLCFAENGLQGQHMVSDDSGLIFLNAELPDINGLNVLRLIKQEYPSIPVIMTTSEGTEGKCLEAFRNGARDYIRKPFKEQEIIQKTAILMNMMPCTQRRAYIALSKTNSNTENIKGPDISQSLIESIGRVTDYIADNLGSSFSLDNACKIATLNRSYFCYYFKRITGYTLNRYITNMRIHKAIELIGSERFSVTEIAHMLGYSNSGIFSSAFKKVVGKSPTKIK